MEYVIQQLSSCLLLLLTGMVFGGFLDLYRVFRGVVRATRTATYYGDLFFWVVTLFLLTPLLYWSTWLELRLYVWLSLLGGVFLYYLSFSRSMIPVFLKFLKVITWFPRQIGDGFRWLWAQVYWVRRHLFRNFFKP